MSGFLGNHEAVVGGCRIYSRRNLHRRSTTESSYVSIPNEICWRRSIRPRARHPKRNFWLPPTTRVALFWVEESLTLYKYLRLEQGKTIFRHWLPIDMHPDFKLNCVWACSQTLISIRLNVNKSDPQCTLRPGCSRSRCKYLSLSRFSYKKFLRFDASLKVH